MVPEGTLLMTDISGQKRFETGLDDELTPRHTVGQAVEHYLDQMRIPQNGLRWTAFSRGVVLDNKRELGDLPVEDTRWAVLPEVSAG
jgi:hypothetical protein